MSMESRSSKQPSYFLKDNMAANIRNNRKEIDEFLVTLDAFMERYRKDYKEMYKVYVPIFKVNSHLNKG